MYVMFVVISFALLVFTFTLCGLVVIVCVAYRFDCGGLINYCVF